MISDQNNQTSQNINNINNTNDINDIQEENQNNQQISFNRKGILCLKNIIDKIEYHLYDNRLSYPICAESIDLNEKLRLYAYNSTNRQIHISILDNNGIIFTGTGKLKIKFESGVEKFYLNNDISIIDLEEILLNNTEKVITIKINVIKFIEINDVAAEEGDKIINEPREYKS